MMGLGLAAGLSLALAACAGPPPQQTPPPPMASADAAPPAQAAPDLAGAPPQDQPPPPQAYGSNAYDAGMDPIPNPEDLPPDARARVYGHRYDEARHHRRDHGVSAQAAPAEAAAAEPAPRHTHTSHIWAWRNPGHAARHTHALRGQQSPRHAQAAPAPAKPAPSVPAAQTPPAGSASRDHLAALQAALSAPVADGSGFVIAEDIAAGKPGAVTLSLPADLFSRIRDQANKAGLGKAARRLDVTASLSGAGYVIAPAAAQTLQPPPAGAPAAQTLAFTWQVQPQAGAGGPIKAVVVAHLLGAGAPQAVPLLALERPVKAAEPAPAPTEDATNPFNLHLGDMDLPGLGKVPVSSILAVLVLILVVAVLVAAARHTAERDRQERRKARAAARAALAAEEAEAAAAAAETHAHHVAEVEKTHEPV